MSPALSDGLFTAELPGKPLISNSDESNFCRVKKTLCEFGAKENQAERNEAKPCIFEGTHLGGRSGEQMGLPGSL